MEGEGGILGVVLDSGDVMYCMILIDTSKVGWKHTLRLMKMESGVMRESL